MKRRRRMKYPSKAHSSGQARVQLGGKRIYLGKFGSQESYDKFNRLVDEYEAGMPLLTERTLTLAFHTGGELQQFVQLAENLGSDAEGLALKLIRDFVAKHPERFLTDRVSRLPFGA